MGMLRICAAEGCETKTLGEFCIDHELTLGTEAPVGILLSFVPAGFSTRSDDGSAHLQPPLLAS
jgi:hypothetical protein